MDVWTCRCFAPECKHKPSERLLRVGAVADDVWQDIPLGLDPRVRDLLGNSVALNTTASVKQDQESSKQ